MYEDLPGLPVFLTLVALAPAIVAWRRGRVLARALDDPALPERLEAERRRNGSIIGVAFGLAAVMSPGSLLWTLPLLIVGQIAAAYPLRKVLYAETWTFPTYLACVGRVVVAIWGFWIVLAVLPLQAPEFGRYDWLVALAGGMALLLWNTRADVVLRRLLGSRPLTDPELIARFTAIAERSGVPVPNFECIPLHGGEISNAIAVPARRRSSVLFTDTLLAQLDADEAAAICAHEIAHLEHHTPRLLRRLDIANIALVVLGAFLSILPRLAGWESTALSSVLWIVALFGVIAWRARDRQKHETASDLRAIALTGDPDALVRALTKLYAFARLPRRIGADVERRATHPSLARRIRDIRAAAGAAPAALSATSIFSAADGCATVTFDSDRLQWTEGDVATYTLNYSQFSELRLQVAADGAKSLVAVERGGRRWQTPLADADVPRLQAVLDIVDARVTGDARPPVTFGNLARIAAACAAMFAFALAQIAMAIAALLALLQPSAAMLAGAGVAALASALAVFRTFSGAALDTQIGLTAMVALLGVALLAGAYTRRGDHPPPRAMAGVAALALCGAFSTGVLLLNGVHPIDLHLATRSNPSSGIFVLALGTTLAALHVRAMRYVAAPVLLGGLTILAAGSAWFLDRFGRDPFLQPAAQITWSSVDGTRLGEMTLPLYPSSVELSPNGRALIVQAYDPDEEELTLHVARTGGTMTRVRATDLVFMDDERVLGVYDAPSGALEIRETTIGAPESVAWHRPLPAFVPGALSYERSTRTWTVRGFAADGALVQVQGHDGAPTTRETRWAALGIGRVPEHAAVTGETAVVHDTQYTPSLLQRQGWWQLALLLPGNHARSRFTRVTGTARTDATITRLQTECVSARASDALLCSAFDGTRTRFASIDAGTAEVKALAWLPGHFRGSIPSASGWLSGWADCNAVAVRPATGEGLRYHGAPGRITQLTVNDRVFAVVSMRGGESIVQIYSRDDARRAARH